MDAVELRRVNSLQVGSITVTWQPDKRVRESVGLG